MIGTRLNLEPVLDTEKLHDDISTYLEFWSNTDLPAISESPARQVSALQLFLEATSEEWEAFFEDGWTFPDSPTWLF